MSIYTDVVDCQLLQFDMLCKPSYDGDIQVTLTPKG